METSQEAKTQALKELSAKLQKEYEEQLQEQRKKYIEDIEVLQVQYTKHNFKKTYLSNVFNVLTH